MVISCGGKGGGVLKIRKEHILVVSVIFLGRMSPPVLADRLENHLRQELVGCRATLLSPVWRVDLKETIETLGNLFLKPPVATWATEGGAIHHLRKSSDSHLEEPKIALMDRDTIEIVAVSSRGRSADLDLVLLSDPAVRATLGLRFSRKLRRNLADINRFWILLERVLELIPDPDNDARCVPGARGGQSGPIPPDDGGSPSRYGLPAGEG